MKHLTKKLFSMLMVVLMLVGMLPMNLITATAAEAAATINFGGGSGSNQDSITISDENSGIKITIGKGTHNSSSPYWATDHVRFYGTTTMSNTMTFTAPTGATITKIVFTTTGSSYTMNNATPNSGNVASNTWTGSADSVEFTTTKQARIKSAVVTYVITDASCNHTNKEDIGEAKNATCTENGITAGEKCSDCGKTITEQETIPATGHTFVDGKCTITDCNATVSQYALVTDMTQISVGDKIIVVASAANFAMGGQSGNNCPQVAVTKGENNTIEVASDSSIQVLTLQNGNKEGTFAFHTGSGYLYAASSSNNNLKIETALSDNSSWTIEIVDGIATVKAQGTNTRNWLRYNSNSKIFSCYTGNRADISIYSFVCEHVNQETIVAKEATCTEDGIQAGTKCSDCGKILDGGETIPAKKHDFENNVCKNCKTNPTELSEAVLALQPGKYLPGEPFTLTGKITEINTEYDSAEEYITVTIAATGYEAVTIKCYHLKAGELYTSADTAGLRVEDTITVTGALMNYGGAVQFAHGCTFTNLESAHTHSYTGTVTAPTCTENGYTTYTCSCGTSYDGNETAALGHSYGEWEITTPAGCTTEGEQKHTCSECGDVQTEVIPVNGHNFVNGVCQGCDETEPEGYLLTTDISQIAATDKVIITMTKDGKVYAMSNDNGNSAPVPVEVQIVDGVLSTEATNIQWNVVYDNGDLTIYPDGTTNTWLYCTGTNNGVRVGTNSDKTFTVDAASGYLKHTATGRYLGIYNTQDFRCYTNTTGNIAGQTLAFYVWHDGYCEHKNTEELAAKPVTCTENGNESGIKCTDCGEVTEGGATIQATGHNIVNNVCTNSCGKHVIEIVEAGETLEDIYTMTGVITEIDEAYNEEYNNSTVTIKIDGHELSVKCYRIVAGESVTLDATTLEHGDTITVEGKLTNYKGDAQFAQDSVLTAVTKLPANCVDGWNVTLGADITVGFKLNISDADTVSATMNGVPAGSYDAETGVLSVPVAAAQMADEITIEVNGKDLEKTYSVVEYARYILDNAATYPAEQDIVKYMLAYGGASQTYFEYNTENLASNGIEVEAKTPVEETSMVIDGSVSGVKFYGASLLHKDRIGMRFYFMGDISALKIATEVKYTLGKADGKCYMEFSDINPQDIGNDFTVMIGSGDDILTVTYSPLDYIVRMYNKENASENIKDLVVALYGYYWAALEYATSPAQ